ncbi:tetratricopeptide repeat protein [candidate division KSB1 bacterium]
MKLTIFMILIACNFGFSIQIHAQTAQECYEQGLALKEAGDIDGAIKLFDKARKKDRNFADANYELALCYMSLGTIRGRILAEYALDRALDKEPGNARYFFALGELRKKQRFIYESIKMFERVIDNDPNFHAARTELARLYTEEEWNHNPEKAEYHLIELSERAPEYPDIHYLLGRAYYQSEEYTRSEMHLLQQLESNPDHALAKLSLGWTYLKMEEYEKSTYFYLEGLKELDDPEKLEEMGDMMWVMFTDEEREAHEALPLNKRGNFYVEFWKRRDPNIVTRENERLIEHLKRVENVKTDYAYDNYRGYDDMGEIYLKYGEPSSIGGSYGIGGSAYERNTDRGDDMITWFYLENIPPTLFHFLINKGGYAYRVPFFNLGTEQPTLEKPLRYIGDYSLTQKYWGFDRHLAPPEQFMYSYPEETYEIPVIVSQFQGDDETTELDIAYGIPYKEILFEQQATGRSADVNSAVLVNDTLGNRLSSEERLTKYLYRESNDPENDVVTGREQVAQKPGIRRIGVSIEQEASGRSGIRQFELPVRDFSGPDLEISDIMILASHDIPDIIPRSSREDLHLTQYLYADIRKSTPLVLYYEIYNLNLDNNGQTAYEVTYSVQRLAVEGTVLERLVDKVGRILTGQDITEIKVSQRRFGYSSKALETISLDISALPAGRSTITVTITDKVSQQTKEISRIIQIIEDK